MLEIYLQYFGGRGASSGINKSQSGGRNGIMELDLQFFAKKASGRKVPKDNPHWDHLVMGDINWQREQGVFVDEFGGYVYLVEYHENYQYKILRKRKKKNIHDGKFD